MISYCSQGPKSRFLLNGSKNTSPKTALATGLGGDRFLPTFETHGTAFRKSRTKIKGFA